jgi:hypothetical protein
MFASLVSLLLLLMPQAAKSRKSLPEPKGQYAAMFAHIDQKIWEEASANGSAIVPHSHWWKAFSDDDWSIVRYDYPTDLVEYGVPGCQVWDLNSPGGNGPVYFQHVMQRDYIEMKAPAEHLIQWTCRGRRYTVKALKEMTKP